MPERDRPHSQRNGELEISFFVPCYNEERNIKATLATIEAATRGVAHEILVVDDGSTDRTVHMVREFMGERPKVMFRLVENGINYGLGFNYFRTAFEARGRYYMLVNGDNVEPEEAIRTIIGRRGEADIVIPYFGSQDRRTAMRRAISRLFTFLANLLSGNRLHYYNGPALHLTENVRFWRAETIGYGYQAELICHLLKHGASFVEVEVPNTNRQWGASKAFALANWLSVANSLFHILLRRVTYAAYVALRPQRARNRPEDREAGRNQP